MSTAGSRSTGHQETRNVVNRLARIEGHVRSVREMVEEGRPCVDVLTQLAAIRAALDEAGKVFLGDHLEHCVVAANSQEELAEAVGELKVALDRLLR